MKILSAMKKELEEIAHDRMMLLILLVFPIVVMLFMGTSFRSMQINGLPVGIVGIENTTYGNMLFSGLGSSPAFDLRQFPSEEQAMSEFKNGQLRAVIIIPQDFDKEIEERNGSEIKIEIDNSDLALEQAVITAMSSVIEASSTNITKAYVNGAWGELEGLNSSASSLGDEVVKTRAMMLQTKKNISAIDAEIDTLNASSIESSLDDASAGIDDMQTLLAEQNGTLNNISSENDAMFNKSAIFLQNASDALNQSIFVIEDTHVKLGSEAQNLNNTVFQLDIAIMGLETAQNATMDNATKIALGLNIASLQSLRNSTETQLMDTENEMIQLEGLNTTLNSFSAELENYTVELNDAKANAGKLREMEGALENASATLSRLNVSLASSRKEVQRLDGLLSDIKATTTQIQGAFDTALAQTDSVDSLITSLQKTVAEQTGKDPARIASPLSVKVESQYSRTSFVDFIMPQVIAVSLLFTCFLLGSISLVRERTGKTIVRALMVPDVLPNLVAAKILTLVLLSFVQVALILLVASLFFGVAGPRDISTLIIGTGISSLVLTSIGVLVGFYSRNETSAIEGCLLIAIPMLFLGNIVFSPDLLPNYTQILQELLPLAHVTSIYKVVLITNGNPGVDVAALFTYFILLGAVLTYVVLTKRDISNYR